MPDDAPPDPGRRRESLKEIILELIRGSSEPAKPAQPLATQARAAAQVRQQRPRPRLRDCLQLRQAPQGAAQSPLCSKLVTPPDDAATTNSTVAAAA